MKEFKDERYTMSGAALILKVSLRTIKRWVAEGIIESYKPAGVRFIKRSEVKRMWYGTSKED